MSYVSADPVTVVAHGTRHFIAAQHVQEKVCDADGEASPRHPLGIDVAPSRMSYTFFLGLSEIEYVGFAQFLSKRDPRQRTMLRGRIVEWLPLVRHRQRQPVGLRLPNMRAGLVHAPLGAIFLVEPHRQLPMQVADHDAIDVALADGDLVDPRWLRKWLRRVFAVHPDEAHP